MKVRKVQHLAGIGSSAKIAVHNNDLGTLTRAIQERILSVKSDQGVCVPPQPEEDIFNCQIFKDFREKILSKIPTPKLMESDEFLSHYQDRPRQRVCYENAFESLGRTSYRSKDAYVSCFVKADKLDLTAKPDPVPRVIQPRSPRYHVSLGCFLKPIENAIYSAINRTFQEEFGMSNVVMKCYNARQRGRRISAKWSKFNHPVFLGMDASRFDQHVSMAAMLYEHSFYNSIWRSGMLQRLLREQLFTTAYGNCDDGKVKYKIRGGRCSGDMNTGLGNIILMCAMMYSVIKSANCRAEFINDGDDCGIICEKSDCARFDIVPQALLRYGFTMVVENPVFMIEQIEFCRSKPVYNGYEWIMVRDPVSAVSKDLVSMRPINNEKQWKQVCYAIAKCGEALAGDIPVFTAFYKTLLDLSNGIESVSNLDAVGRGLLYPSLGMQTKFTEPTDACRASFFLAYGFTPHEQREIEETYRSFANITYSHSVHPAMVVPFLSCI